MRGAGELKLKWKGDGMGKSILRIGVSTLIFVWVIFWMVQ